MNSCEPTVAALAQQRRDERRRELGRRFLLVLAVVVGLPLAPEISQTPSRQRARGPEASASRIRVVRPRWCSASWISRARARTLPRSAAPRRRSAARPSPCSTCAPAVEVSSERGKRTRSSTNWCAGRDRPQGRRASAGAPTTPRTQAGAPQTRYAGPSVAGAAARARRVSRSSADRPLVAPDLQVHVHHVVVGDGHPAERGSAPRTSAARRGPVVPDDPHALVGGRDAERSRRAEAAELRGRARPVLR